MRHRTPSIRLVTDNEPEGTVEPQGDGVWPVVETLLIGREGADVTIALPALSRRHASVTADDHGVVLRDLASKNGTAVNGRMLTDAPHPLRHGDSIVLAGAVELRYHDPDATPHAPRLGRLRGLWIDERTRDVWIDAERLEPPLSARQQDLLELLVEADGRRVDKVELVERLWPDRSIDSISMDAVDSLIKRLRRRLSAIEHDDPVLEIWRGRGIRLRRERRGPYADVKVP